MLKIKYYCNLSFSGFDIFATNLQSYKMSINPHLSFNNTAIAFSSKSNVELKKAHFLFSLMNLPWLVRIGTWSITAALALHLPIKFLVKKTIFAHFCGGESIPDAQTTIEKLADSNIQTILDFSAEGEESESEFDKTTAEQLRITEFASKSKNLPFSVMKISGVASNALLEKIQRKESLTSDEEEAFQRVKDRVQSICKKSYELNVKLMIDAEETWIQEPIDAMTYEMMAQYNKENPIIWNTFQMYRLDMLDNLKRAFEIATSNGYWLGAKLVRGAYMEKEREAARDEGRPDPVQLNKNATDNDYNAAINFCLENMNHIGVFAGTHNDQSNLNLAEEMGKLHIENDHPNIWFGQLYGMSDHISYSLAQAGYNVAKYVPYGPVEKVLPYLFRRAEENTAMAGQSSREYLLVKEEIARRKSQN